MTTNLIWNIIEKIFSKIISSPPLARPFPWCCASACVSLPPSSDFGKTSRHDKAAFASVPRRDEHSVAGGSGRLKPELRTVQRLEFRIYAVRLIFPPCPNRAISGVNSIQSSARNCSRGEGNATFHDGVQRRPGTPPQESADPTCGFATLSELHRDVRRFFGPQKNAKNTQKGEFHLCVLWVLSQPWFWLRLGCAAPLR
jgi:hypothetical protein